LNYQDSILQFSVNTLKNSKAKIDINLSYYWLNVDKVNMNVGGYGGYLLHGSYLVYDHEKHLLTEGFFINGLKSGVWKKWSSAGQLKLVENWDNGIKEGNEIVYDGKGNKLNSNNYRKGKLDGLCYCYANDSTKILKYKDGKLLKDLEPKKVAPVKKVENKSKPKPPTTDKEKSKNKSSDDKKADKNTKATSKKS